MNASSSAARARASAREGERERGRRREGGREGEESSSSKRGGLWHLAGVATGGRVFLLATLSQRVIVVTFVADGRTLPHLRVECDFASGGSDDARKQRYVHEFSSQCISDQLEVVTLQLDSYDGHLLENALTKVRSANPAFRPPHHHTPCMTPPSFTHRTCAGVQRGVTTQAPQHSHSWRCGGVL